MTLLRQILRLCVVMLFSVFGANMTFAMPMAKSDITYFQTETIHIAQGDDVSFAARAPPMAADNVVVAGGVTVMQGSAFVLHGQETVAALFGFDGDLNATNTATRGADDIGTGTVDTGLIGDGQSFAGHGGIQANADGSLPTTTVPEGTFVTVPVGPNRALYDNAGQLIESGNVPSGMSVQTGQSLTDPRYLADTTTGAVTYLPGPEIPNYQLIPPNYFPNQPVNPLSNSTVVDTPTPLSQLLQPNAGCVNWAACTTVYGSPTTTPNFGGIDP
jgi:hypothetical protein